MARGFRDRLRPLRDDRGRPHTLVRASNLDLDDPALRRMGRRYSRLAIGARIGSILLLAFVAFGNFLSWGWILGVVVVVLAYQIVADVMGFRVDDDYAGLGIVRVQKFRTKLLGASICPVCGYNLAGLEPQGEIIECPECAAGWRRDRVGADLARLSGGGLRRMTLEQCPIALQLRPMRVTDARGTEVPVIALKMPKLVVGPYADRCRAASERIFESAIVVAEKVCEATLDAGLCPSCWELIEGLAPATDGCTVCPECGAGWRLGSSSDAEGVTKPEPGASPRAGSHARAEP